MDNIVRISNNSATGNTTGVEPIRADPGPTLLLDLKPVYPVRRVSSKTNLLRKFASNVQTELQRLKEVQWIYRTAKVRLTGIIIKKWIIVKTIT